MTDLTALTTEQVRIVRDDRVATTDGLYRILEQPLDGVTLRTTLFAYMTDLTVTAFSETLTRLQKRGTNE